ncbi:MAG: alpha/beta fold hydrolase, partial [Pseudomonadales bacterium]
MEQREIMGAAGPLAVTVEGTGPLILCVHGWPELAYSWRHQSAYFSARGYTVAALDVRGYGGSVKPSEVSAYTLPALAADVTAVAAALAPEPAVLFGHDWGAPICWNTAALHPERVAAVAGLSVPYRQRQPVSQIAFWRRFYKD